MLWSAHFTTQAFEECIQMYVLYQIEWNAQHTVRATEKIDQYQQRKQMSERKSGRRSFVCEVYNRTLYALNIQANTHSLFLSLFLSTHTTAVCWFGVAIIVHYVPNRAYCYYSFSSSHWDLAYHLNEPVKRNMCGATTTSWTTTMLLLMMMTMVMCLCVNECVSFIFFSVFGWARALLREYSLS